MRKPLAVALTALIGFAFGFLLGGYGRLPQPCLIDPEATP